MIINFDHLDDTEFENFCYDLLGALGLLILIGGKELD